MEKYKSGSELVFKEFRNGLSPCESGIARLCIERYYLHAYGVFQDSDIYNDAVSDNGETWLTGDVFELFFQPVGREDYYEAHLAPNGVRLQLHIQDYRTFRDIPHSKKICNFGLTGSTKINRENNQWAVEMVIPFRGLGIETAIGARFVFARYNYTHGHKHPEITSTAVFPKTVHYPELWHIIGQ